MIRTHPKSTGRAPLRAEPHAIFTKLPARRRLVSGGLSPSQPSRLGSGLAAVVIISAAVVISAATALAAPTPVAVPWQETLAIGRVVPSPEVFGLATGFALGLGFAGLAFLLFSLLRRWRESRQIARWRPESGDTSLLVNHADIVCHSSPQAPLAPGASILSLAGTLLRPHARASLAELSRLVHRGHSGEVQLPLSKSSSAAASELTATVQPLSAPSGWSLWQLRTHGDESSREKTLSQSASSQSASSQDHSSQSALPQGLSSQSASSQGAAAANSGRPAPSPSPLTPPTCADSVPNDLIEQAPIGFLTTDAQGRLTYVNGRLSSWLGITAPTLLGTQKTAEKSVNQATHRGWKLHDILTTPSPEANAAPYRIFADPEIDHGRVTFCGAAGRRLHAVAAQQIITDSQGRLSGMQAAIFSLDQAKAVAKTLGQSQRAFRRFFKEAPIAMAMVNARLQVLEINQALARLCDHPAHLLSGQSLLTLIATDDQVHGKEILARADAATQQAQDPPLEVRLRRRNSAQASTSCILYASRFEQEKNQRHYLIYFINNSQQKALEAQFAQSQKMQALGQLAGGIAHDFNNALTAMLGFCDLLLQRHPPGQRNFTDLMQIKQSGVRAANLVGQLLAFSRQQTLRPTLIDVSELLSDRRELFRAALGERIELRVVHDRDLGPIRADSGQLEDVLLNLVVNARDAMPEGGVVTITTRSLSLPDPSLGDDIPDKVKMPPGPYVRIDIADTGAGIDPDLGDRIFDPFFSTKVTGAGTGLGLAQVYGTIKQSGGFIFYCSALATGSCFSIYLPQQDEQAFQEQEHEKAVHEDRARPRQDLSGSGSILLVEDEQAVRLLASRALSTKGYRVHEASDSRDARALLDDRSLIFDLMITDVVMPEMDGPDLAAHARRSRPHLPVIFMSGYAEDTLRQRLGEEALFLSKPFDIKDLAEKVKLSLQTRPCASL